MKRSLRALCLALALILLLSVCPAAAAPDTVLLLQMGTGTMLAGGAKAAVPKPVYASNGAILLPLRAVAKAMGAQVGWDAPLRQAVVELDGVTCRFTEGSRTYQAGGESRTLNAPAQNRNGSLYVPVPALEGLGLSVHAWDDSEGGFLAVSRGALSDEALARYHAQALAAFGPNEGLLAASSIVLRQGSRKALASGKTVDLCEKGGNAVPGQSGDGYLLVPIRACAEALGGTYALNEDGSSTVTLNGHTAVFPAAHGYVTVDGERREHASYGGALRNGTAFCSVYAFSNALGYCGYAQGDAILISAYNLDKRPDLRAYAWKEAEALTLQRYEDAKGFLALTFDDGPSGPFTTRLLDGLKARGVHATFFLCNYRIQIYPGLMGRYLTEGHEVGNHSANHATLTACAAGKLAAELDQTSASIQRLCGVAPALMRPPGGAYNQTVLSAAGARGMSCIMWSVDTLDWKNRNVQSILQRTLPNVRDGDIILMHDMYATSIDAALSMIDTLQAQGYVFVTVSELAQLKGVTLQPGVSYSSIR